MKTIQDLKLEKENKVTQLIAACGMFFAFSNEQFTKNKTPLLDGEKYVSIGAGAYLPKSKFPVYIQGTKDIDKWYKSAVKNSKLRAANILYELQNHEAFYTGTIEDTLDALGSGYTQAEVWAVFMSNRGKY